MGTAILDGFERGFSMMERHDSRMGRKDRLARIDEQNESRYQDGQTRLADMDKKNEEHYQDSLNRRKTNDANTAEYRASMLSESQGRSANQKKQYQWQKNKANEQEQWGLIAPQLQNIHEQYFESGAMPEQAAKFFQENPQYADYSPESYRDPEHIKSAKALKTKTTEIFKAGKLHQFKDPEYIELFNGAFKSKIQQGVGEVDLVRNAKVLSKRVAQLVPTRNGKISIGLEVTYQKQDGEEYTEIQPMTHGRTGEKEDPVTELDMKELLSAIDTRSNMADMAENGDKYRNRSSKTLGAMGFGKKGKSGDEKAYRKEMASIEKDLTNAIAKIQANTDVSVEQSDRDAAIERTKSTFQQRKDALNKSYGIETETSPDPDEEVKAIQYKSTIEGHDVDGVVERFMSANKNMTKEQALQAAIKQGYISE